MGANGSKTNVRESQDVQWYASPRRKTPKKTPKGKQRRMWRQKEQQLSPPTSPAAVERVASPVRSWAKSGSSGPSPKPRNPWVKKLDFDTADEMLGAGTFANVVVAYPRKEGAHYKFGVPMAQQKVAAKVMEKRNIPQEMKYVITQECNTIAQLNHPNIIKILSAYENKSHIYLFMPLLSGGDLHSFIESRGRLPELTAYKIFVQLVEALCYSHSQNVVHRDIKLENIILVDKDSVDVQLVDFGFATTQLIDGPNLEDYPGSPAYAAPELTKGIPYRGRKSDVWALGVTLYTMVCGQYPFWNEDVDEMYYRIAYASPEFRSSWALSPSLRSLIGSMLNKNPDLRPSMKQIRNHLWLSQQQHRLQPKKKLLAPASAKKLSTPGSPFSKQRFVDIGRRFSSPLKPNRNARTKLRF